MADSHINTAAAERIKHAFARIFPTMKMIGETMDVVLYRDAEEDGTPNTVSPQNVLIEWAAREPAVQRGQGTSYDGRQGELQKETPFNVQNGDRFTLPGGLAGYISGAPYTVEGVVYAPFTVGA